VKPESEARAGIMSLSHWTFRVRVRVRVNPKSNFLALKGLILMCLLIAAKSRKQKKQN